MTAVETTTRLAVGSLEKIFAHAFLGYVFFRWEFTLKNTTQCVCGFFSPLCFLFVFFSSSCFNSWFGYLVVGFSGLFGFRIWLPGIDHRI